ncbi:MAG: methionine synthase, partial [bacterium]
LLLGESYRSFYVNETKDLNDVLEQWTQWDNRVIGDREDLTVAMHVCRGNQASRWLVEGSYEPLAEVLFQRLNVDRFLLEYDDERSGGFEPLRKMPDNKQVMLGLMTTKHSELETTDDLRAGVRRAAQYHPKENLGLCPQCGFSSSTVGNKLSHEDQKRKLRRLVEAVNRIDWNETC